MKRNPNFAKLQSGYIFPEVRKRVNAFLEKEPNAELISLGVGDTTEPLPEVIANAMAEYAKGLGTADGYHGYGPAEGRKDLREAIASKIYKGRVSAEEIFVSDGSKPAIGRLQFLFTPVVKVALQDPAYPVPVDSTLITGHDLQLLPCTPENDFWPSEWPDAELIYVCSPNNPTGTVATHQQLEELVALAKKRKSIIVFDSAYAAYIQDETLPRSIFEIDGAEEVAVECGSFSKIAGFTGVRLGWMVVPKELHLDDERPFYDDWSRTWTTIFNGASNIAQAGGVACLTDEGMAATQGLIDYYRANTATLHEALTGAGLDVYGGINAPYLWAHFPEETSWEAFDDILANTHIITTPGSGFGPAGENFLRFSSYGHHLDVEKAAERLKEHLGQK